MAIPIMIILTMILMLGNNGTKTNNANDNDDNDNNPTGGLHRHSAVPREGQASAGRVHQPLAQGPDLVLAPAAASERPALGPGMFVSLERRP